MRGWQRVASDVLAALVVGVVLALAVAALAWALGVMVDAVSWALSRGPRADLIPSGSTMGQMPHPRNPHRASGRARGCPGPPRSATPFGGTRT